MDLIQSLQKVGVLWRTGTQGKLTIDNMMVPTVRTPYSTELMAGKIPTRDTVAMNIEFMGQAVATHHIPAPFVASQETANSTIEYVASTHGGGLALTLATTSEAEICQLDAGDILSIDLLKNPIVSFRVKLHRSATFAAGDYVLIGVGSAYNSTPDSVTTNAWFKLIGANSNILVETDDGTTDNDDNDTGEDWTSDDIHDFTIDLTDLSSVKFYIDGEDVTPETMSLAAIVTSTKVQPYIALVKASGTTAHVLTVQRFALTCDR